jgi:hypothetical protein
MVAVYIGMKKAGVLDGEQQKPFQLDSEKLVEKKVKRWL